MVETSFELKLNYYALVVAILAPATTELSFELLQSDEDLSKVRHKRCDLTQNDVLDMIELKKKMTYRELSEVYCLDATAIYRKVKKQEKII